MTLAAGQKLGPYEILAPLGAGGMGEVYRARDSRLRREVAIKVLSAELSADADRRNRFEQEARSASALNHHNIVTVHEIGTSDATIYIAMELVDGKTLREVLQGGPLPTKRLLDIAYQIADGLAKAHAAGIVHRDLKPENVMVTKDGVVKILDFGLAKLLKTQNEEVSNIPTATRAGTVMGTVGYMSPEQASGRPLDFRSDQFSLGSILYEMATGKRAFQRGTSAETLTAIIREETEPVERLNAAMPAPFRWIVERCLQKDPEERYASTRDLAQDVRSVREHLSDVSASGEVARGTGPRRARAEPPPDPARGAVGRRAARGARRRDAPPEAFRQDGAALLPADHLRQRHDPRGALRAGRPDDHLQRGLGRQSDQALPEASLEPRLAPAGAAEREPARDLSVRGDGHRRRLPLEPPRRLRGHARARGPDRRISARRRRRDPGGRLGPGRHDAARRAGRQGQVPHRVSRSARSSTRPPATSATRVSLPRATASPFWTIPLRSTTRGPWRTSTSRARRRR